MKFTFAPEAKPLEGYTIKRALHRGGFGEVYYAVSDAGKDVALKLLQNNREIELRGVSQCLNLKHPNLVTIYDIRTDADGDSWIVMEYVRGETLAEVIDQHPNGLPAEQVSRMLNGLCEGLAFLHERGIVHRDLKPANLYLEDNTVKIGDVGLSKFIAESRRSAQTQSVGTVYYMAPEVTHGKYGLEVDVYAAGIILFEMLTGDVPFDGHTTGEILMKHLTEHPNLSALPERVQPVIAQALMKDPQQRTSSARVLAQEFSDALRGVTKPFPKQTGPAITREPPNLNGDTQPRLQPHSSPSLPPKPMLDRIMGDFQRLWHNPGMRWIMIAMAILILIVPRMVVSASWSLLFVGFCVAVGIAMFRAIQLIPKSPPPRPRHESDEPPPQERTTDKWEPPLHRQQRRERRHVPLTAHRGSCNYESLRKIGWLQYTTELSSSLTLSVICTAIITTGLWLLELLDSPAEIGLFSMTSLVGSWCVLLLGKICEITENARKYMRFGLAVAGAFPGWFAYQLAHSLMYRFDSGSDAVFREIGRISLTEASRQPSLVGFIVFFSVLFGLRVWWPQVHAYRRSVFSIGSALMTAFVGWFITVIFAFPHQWGVMWAVAISSIVQLSASWTPPGNRVRNRSVNNRSEA